MAILRPHIGISEPWRNYARRNYAPCHIGVVTQRNHAKFDTDPVATLSAFKSRAVVPMVTRCRPGHAEHAFTCI
jgi:hypothetical protein